uniref:Uncharacterized protein n=1 Tax=Siphoviridae sp. cthrK8 TaxID=2826429 RepID=A0A8S5MZZ5_9CAUD|nr:MAG TPA: hypothetical protein [Siphoviridae sp. cthrK8]
MVKRSEIFLCCHVDLNLLAYIMIKIFFKKSCNLFRFDSGISHYISVSSYHGRGIGR